MSDSEDISDPVAALGGPGGGAWRDRLPQLLADLAEQWRLTDVGAAFPGARTSFVAPAVGPTGAHLVLKASPVTAWVRHEALALGYWGGQGVVRLHEVDIARGALLIERAMPGSTLVTLAISDDRAATEIASGVIAKLNRADPPPGELPTIESWLDSLKLSPVRSRPSALLRACQEARAAAKEMLSTSDDRVVLHGDLHQGNILSVPHGGWVAVDPKGLIGPREVETAALLRNPRRYLLAQPDPAAVMRTRVAALAERLDYDPGLIAGWGFVLSVLAAAWAFEDEEGDPEVGRWLSSATALREAGRTVA